LYKCAFEENDVVLSSRVLQGGAESDMYLLQQKQAWEKFQIIPEESLCHIQLLDT
jgi:hypothetical protein